MKVYTEIVYTWNDEKSELVEESSKSYEYQGEVTQCDERKGKKFGISYNIPHSHGGTMGEIQDTVEDVGEGNFQDLAEGGLGNLGTNLGDPIGSTETILTGGNDFLEDTGTLDVIREGPGGSFADATNLLYGGDLKKGVESAQEFYRDAEGGFNYYKDKNFGLGDKGSSGDILDEDGDDEDTSGEGDITDEEKEALLKRGSVASGGRTGYRGRKHHVTGTQSSTILAPSGPR